jgi:nicotinate-nucleotide adenylyltransferase
MKLCLFGGTFDPPHVGHLIIGEFAYENLNVEKVLFIPAYIPPHKTSQDFSSPNIRFKMLELSIQGNPHFQISRIELDRTGISYSIDTIREIRNEFNLEQNDLFFLIGSDSLIEFHTWKNPEEIVSLTQVVVASRPFFDKKMVKNSFLDKINFLNAPYIDISSSMVRERVRKKKSIRYIVTKEVNEFIIKNKLYAKNL